MDPHEVINGRLLPIRLAAKTRSLCGDVCGVQAQIFNSTTNLYGVLRRLRTECGRNRSPFNRPGADCREDFESLSSGCRGILDDVHKYLLAFKTLNRYEAAIDGKWELTVRQNATIDHFESEITTYTLRLSQILIAASAEMLGGLDEQLDHSTGIALSAPLNDLTARLVANTPRLVANGDIRLSMLVKGQGNEEVLWGALQTQLLGNGLEQSLLARHKRAILRYVRALERRSTFGQGVEATSADKPTARVKLEAKNDEDRKTHERTKQEADPKTNTSDKKRTRSKEDESPELPGSNKRRSGDKSFFRFRDPKETFGPDIDHDLLADFLEEEVQSSQQHGLRNQIRYIYRNLSEDYEPRWEFLALDRRDWDEKEHRVLAYDIENRVVLKLDNLDMTGIDSKLRELRKMIVKKAQHMLDELEKIKPY